MLLVYVSELNGFANLECAAISIIKSHDKTEESGFTSSVRAIMIAITDIIFLLFIKSPKKASFMVL